MRLWPNAKKPMEVCKKCQHDTDKCVCDPTKLMTFSLERCNSCGVFNAPDAKCKLCNSVNFQYRPIINKV